MLYPAGTASHCQTGEPFSSLTTTRPRNYLADALRLGGFNVDGRRRTRSVAERQRTRNVRNRGSNDIEMRKDTASCVDCAGKPPLLAHRLSESCRHENSANFEDISSLSRRIHPT